MDWSGGIKQLQWPIAAVVVACKCTTLKFGCREKVRTHLKKSSFLLPKCTCNPMWSNSKSNIGMSVLKQQSNWQWQQQQQRAFLLQIIQTMQNTLLGADVWWVEYVLSFIAPFSVVSTNLQLMHIFIVRYDNKIQVVALLVCLAGARFQWNGIHSAFEMQTQCKAGTNYTHICALLWLDTFEDHQHHMEFNAFTDRPTTNWTQAKDEFCALFSFHSPFYWACSLFLCFVFCMIVCCCFNSHSFFLHRNFHLTLDKCRYGFLFLPFLLFISSASWISY